MKAVLLAGGLGTRFAEETDIRPKPMIEIGGKPILWHIMKIYSSHGINDFIVCLGYKGYVIKEYFSNYFLHQSNVTFDMRANKMEVLENHSEPWKVTLIDTGDETMIGGRIKRVLPYIGQDEDFCLTYGDGVSDINITDSIAFHRREGRLATVTATQPPGRYGAINSRWDPSNRLSGKAARRRRLDQWRFFCSIAQDRKLRRGRCNDLGKRADDEFGKGWPNERLLSRRVLASDGYVARQAILGRPLVEQQSPLEKMVNGRPKRISSPVWRATSPTLIRHLDKFPFRTGWLIRLRAQSHWS